MVNGEADKIAREAWGLGTSGADQSAVRTHCPALLRSLRGHAGSLVTTAMEPFLRGKPRVIAYAVCYCDEVRSVQAATAVFRLRVVDRIFFEPVLVSYLIDARQSTSRNACSQKPGFPYHACRKADQATQQSGSKDSSSGAPALLRTAGQHAYHAY